MKTPHRLACILIVLFALTAGCGGNDDKNSSPTTVFTPSATTAVGGSPTTGVATPTSAGAVVQGVTDGSPCSPQGARGVTKDGLGMLCALTGGETRWRPV